VARRLRLDSPLNAVGLDAGARPLGRLSLPAATVRTMVAVAIVPMVGVTVWLALTSDHLHRPTASALYWSYLTAAPMAIGLFWWARRPVSRFGPLLIVFGVLAWVVSWQSSDASLPFDVGVLVEGPWFWLTFYLFLAFPMGRLEPRGARWLMLALGLVVVAFFLPWALFSPVIAGGGPLTACAPNCPANVLQIASLPDVVTVAGKAETYTALIITAATLVVYLMRVRSASRSRRRALIAVAVTSLLFLPARFAFSFSASVLKLDPATLDTLAWGVVGTRVLLPLGFLIALLQSDVFAGRALRTLLEELGTRPTPERWRDIIAGALDDPSLRLGFFDPDGKRFVEPDGAELTPPGDGSGQRWVLVERSGQPVAAMVLDETMTEDPELVRAATSATLLAVENGHLEGELRASRGRIIEAGHEARKRMERDLHDSAQQRLVALRVHLTLTSEQLERDGDRAMLDRLGVEVDETIDELRDLAHGLYPQILPQMGVGPALRSIARRSAMRVTIRDNGIGRHPEVIESTIYFCCLEGLQNASKHAGPDASATVHLDHDRDHVRFCVEDDGVGFDSRAVERGVGLVNLADRVAAVSGSLRVDTAPGRGTRIIGELPVT
jgi:signal transduction histidine kinase